MVDGQSLTNIIRARLLESLELILFLARQLFLSWVDLLGHVIPVVKVRRVQGVLELGCPWGLVALLNKAVPLHLVEPRMPLDVSGTSPEIPKALGRAENETPLDKIPNFSGRGAEGG